MVFATDSVVRFSPLELLDVLIEGPGAMNADVPVDHAAYCKLLPRFVEILGTCYRLSPVFRRLFNNAGDTHLQEARWLLAADNAFGTTVSPAQQLAAGKRKVIGLNEDPLPGHGELATYVCAGPAQPFSLARFYVHEVIHALTLLPDEDDGKPRGACGRI
jgi:PipA/GogA/GtgA family effector protease